MTEESTFVAPQSDGAGSHQQAPRRTANAGLGNTTAAQPKRQKTTIVRKKLPWLDGPHQSSPGYIPGQFGDPRDASDTEKLDSTSLSSTLQDRAEAPITRYSASAIGGDPALRATGSEPSLHDRTKSGQFETLFLNSRSPKRRASSRIHEPTNRRVIQTRNQPKKPHYASSVYSVTQSSESRDALPPSLPKRDPSSYERLVDQHGSRRSELSRIGPDTTPPTRSTAALPYEPPLSSSGQPPHRSIAPRTGKWSTGTSHRPRLRELPRIKTVQPQSVDIQPSGMLSTSTDANVLPARRSTIFAMPTHLLASSSSSSTPGDSTISSTPKPVSSLPRRTADCNGEKNLNATSQGQQAQSIDRAVTGLETLVGEALSAARNAAKTGRNDDVAQALGNATLALRRASSAKGQKPNRPIVDPLVLSPINSEHGSESEPSDVPRSDASSIDSRRHSFDTIPTILTKSAQSSKQPIIVNRNSRNSQGLRSQRASAHDVNDDGISPRGSMSRTPPALYEPASVESIVRDFAYARSKTAKDRADRAISKSFEWGTASDYYGDTGQSVLTQPGVRPSINPPIVSGNFLPDSPGAPMKSPRRRHKKATRPSRRVMQRIGYHEGLPVRRLSAVPTTMLKRGDKNYAKLPDPPPAVHQRTERKLRHPHLAHLFESPYYRQDHERSALSEPKSTRKPSAATNARYEQPNVEKKDYVSEDSLRKHVSLREGQAFSLGRYHRRQPIAREWSTSRKRITAAIACMNTVFIGLIAGIYAGEVPRIQYQLADTTHKVILGNVLLFACLGVTTLVFWPLPLLHGRKPYTLLAFAITLPLLFPQALAVSSYRSPETPLFRLGLLMPRAFKGIALGFANINFLPTLFDLFGASLMSEMPHQEIVDYDDIRRQGGGMGVWLGIWSFCFVGSMSIGFGVGAMIISALDPSWAFYIIVIILAFFLLINVIAPETRRSPYRRSIAQFIDGEDNLKRRVARGEVKLHISNEGPKFWWQEVWAGLILTKRMVFQPGFFVLMLYLGWMYAQVTLVILLLGALLSRDYQWQPQYVGGASLAMAIGAFLALPLSKANIFSRSRATPPRTDSMTIRHSGHVTWSSHMLRRCLFTLTLPFAALAYTLSSLGPSVSWTTPTIFSGLIGFLSNLAIAECVGIIMETFDTCDLQPGVNSKHRLQSLAETTRRRRTNYSSFPRVCAGFFAAQSLGFVLSAAATGVSGDVTRALGAQISTAIVAAILLVLTVLFIAAVWRWKEVQVVPNNAAGAVGPNGIVCGPAGDDPEWKAVIIGNPSGKSRRVNLLELGALSRWTEIRRLNKLIRE